jgi:hypothetical protein
MRKKKEQERALITYGNPIGLDDKITSTHTFCLASGSTITIVITEKKDPA